jgi:integrase
MVELRVSASPERLSVEELGDRYLTHLEVVLERKPTTISDYGSILRRHLAPHFGSKAIDRVAAEDFAVYVRMKLEGGLQHKTVSNHLTFAHGLFAFALKRGLVASNPVAGVDRPRPSGPSPDIRYLAREELEALIRVVPADLLGPTDRVLYLTAATTGMRQGELLALRWRDVDWSAGVIRIRRSITRGLIGTPKSRRSSRAVPVADRLGGELDLHFRRSNYRADADLVFAHPETGRPYDPSKLRRRFKDALNDAGLRSLRFHDLRHTFGTSMAAVGVPMRTLQEWMGHRDFKTTLIYADYARQPVAEREWIERAFDTDLARRDGVHASGVQLNGKARDD